VLTWVIGQLRWIELIGLIRTVLSRSKPDWLMIAIFLRVRGTGIFVVGYRYLSGQGTSISELSAKSAYDKALSTFLVHVFE
jgi:hypothetical protein